MFQPYLDLGIFLHLEKSVYSKCWRWVGRVFFYLINVVDKNSFELIFEKKKKDWRRLMKKLKILIFGIVLQEVGFLTFDSNIEI